MGGHTSSLALPKFDPKEQRTSPSPPPSLPGKKEGPPPPLYQTQNLPRPHGKDRKLCGIIVIVIKNTRFTMCRNRTPLIGY